MVGKKCTKSKKIALVEELKNVDTENPDGEKLYDEKLNTGKGVYIKSVCQWKKK